MKKPAHASPRTSAKQRRKPAADARGNGSPRTDGKRNGVAVARSLPVAKQCPTCGTSFTRRDLIEARSITPIGMLHIQGEPASTAIYCFTHTPWACRTTFGLPVETFRDEIKEEIPDTFLNGTDACGGHCSRLEDLEECHSACTLAPYRRYLLQQLVRRRR